jgi:hypothetical protein
VGFDLPSDYGPPRIRPSLPGSDFFVPTRNLSGYLFTTAEGRANARDIFLDGNTFSDSHSVDKENFVGTLQFGGAITLGDARLSYTHVLITKEFEGQKEAPQVGAVTLSYFLTGCVVHFLCEISGLNGWYCKHGHACTNG